MASLTDKLKDLGVQVGTSKIPSPQKSDRLKQDLVSYFSGSWESTPAGDCFVIRKDFPLSTNHGHYDLTLPSELNSGLLLPNISGPPEISLSDFLFIDTETTGLSGGAGTYVFLIGAAKYVDNQLHFAQFFLQDPSQESSQLAALETFLSSTRVIVSYNGKSFDLPRIRTRYRFHNWPNPFQDFYHLDLLHIARRIWKDHLPSCTLGELERELLCLEREEHDIPGWEVSEYFFRYLQDRNPRPLERVFYHNEVDVISLVSLLGYISDRLSDPLRDDLPAKDDLVSISKYLSILGYQERARQILTSILPLNVLSQNLQLDGLELLAALYKKEGNFIESVPLWKEAAGYGSVISKVELAKYYEHQIADFQEAIHWTLSAIETYLSSGIDKSSQISKSSLEHRLHRLKRKAVR